MSENLAGVLETLGAVNTAGSVPQQDDRKHVRGQASPDFDLRARLKRLRIKQVHFADQIGRDHSGVRRWIAKKPPAPGEIEMLVDVLDVLLLGAPEPQWLVSMKARYGQNASVEVEE